ncbi:hypothetical protein [Dictyobacter aurantiacus]|nr:hypothetical protein [Dictyobacter aurantiacus]
MNSHHEQAHVPAKPRDKTPHRRDKILFSSFLILVVLAGAAFSASLLLAQHTPSRAASAPQLNGDIATMQSAGNQSLRLTVPSTSRLKTNAQAATTSAPAFNNIGISTATNTTAANFDSAGYSYSFNALLETDIEPNLPFAYDGLQFQWPNINHVSSPTLTDNWQASGQVLPLSASGAHKVGFIGSASNGAVSGNALVTYSDNSTQTFSLGFSDWTLGGSTQSPAFGNKIVVGQARRDSRSGEQSVKTYLFYASINLDANKTPVSVKLPTLTSKAQLHVFTYTNDVAPAHDYNNTGMSGDAYTTAGNLDGAGNSYSSKALSWGAGYTISYNQGFSGEYSMQFQWPDVLPGTPDNYQANGQTIAITPVPLAAKLGFVGAATGGPSYGTATLHFDDGSQQQFSLGFSDWTLNGYTRAPSYGNRYFEGMQYRNTRGGQQKINTFLFYAEVDLPSGKNVTSVTLPASTNQGQIHVYSISTGVAGFFDNVGVSGDQSSLFGNFDGGYHSYSAQAMQNAGVIFSTPAPSDMHPYRVNGINFYMRASNDVVPDNWVANGQMARVNIVTSATTLGFIGSAVNGGSTGTGLITYTDGTTQQYTLGFSDWCATTPQYHNSVIASMGYRNGAYGQQAIKNNLYYAEVPLQMNKILDSVQLPTTTGGVMHIFAVAEGLGNYNNIGISDDHATKQANLDGAGYSYSAQALQSAGITAGTTFAHDGFNFKFGTNDGGTTLAGSPDNYVAVGQNIDTVPTAGRTSIGFILSSTGGGVSGTATIYYADGTSQDIPLGAADWCNGATAAQYRGYVVATMKYRNTPGGQQSLANYLYYTSYTLNNTNPAGPVTKIVLPNLPQLHIFSIAYK